MIPHDAGLVADLRTALPNSGEAHPDIPDLGAKHRRRRTALPGWMLALKINKIMMLGLCSFAGVGATAASLIVSQPLLIIIGQRKIDEGNRQIRTSKRLAAMVRDDAPYTQKDQGRILHDNAVAAEHDEPYTPPEPATPENTASEDARAEGRAGYLLR